MQHPPEDDAYQGISSLKGMRFWDRIVTGLFRGTLRRYLCVILAEAVLREHIPGSAAADITSVETELLNGEKGNPGSKLRNFLTLPLWCIVRVLPLKNDHPFAKDSRESFTNKVTPEALFLGLLIWLSVLLILGSVILHKTLPAS